MSDFHTQRHVRARKPRQCAECATGIDAGTFYVRAAGVWEGNFYQYDMHVGCDWLRHAFNDTRSRDEFARTRQRQSEPWACYEQMEPLEERSFRDRVLGWLGGLYTSGTYGPLAGLLPVIEADRVRAQVEKWAA